MRDRSPAQWTVAALSLFIGMQLTVIGFLLGASGDIFLSFAGTALFIGIVVGGFNEKWMKLFAWIPLSAALYSFIELSVFPGIPGILGEVFGWLLLVPTIIAGIYFLVMGVGEALFVAVALLVLGAVEIKDATLRGIDQYNEYVYSLMDDGYTRPNIFGRLDSIKQFHIEWMGNEPDELDDIERVKRDYAEGKLTDQEMERGLGSAVGLYNELPDPRTSTPTIHESDGYLYVGTEMHDHDRYLNNENELDDPMQKWEEVYAKILKDIEDED